MKKLFFLILGIFLWAVSAQAAITAPLVAHPVHPAYFKDPTTGKAWLPFCSHTWDDVQDTSQSTSPPAFDFNGYVSFLQSYGHNCTILWHKDLPTYFNWQGGTWHMTLHPWARTGPGNADDGLPKFDFNTFNQPFFDRVLARAQQLNNVNIYPIVQIFDGLGVTDDDGAGSGFPFHNGNNINSINDGGSTGAFTSCSNPIMGIMDAYVVKLVQTLNSVPGVIWEPQEEGPNGIQTCWVEHVMATIRSTEASLTYQHPILYASINVSFEVDTTLYNSSADIVAPKAKFSPLAPSCGTGSPTCKVNVNDSDHTYFLYLDSAQVNRQYLWQNFMYGNGVMFMDPYIIYIPANSRNLCASPANGVCTGVDTRWNNFRTNLGQAASYVSRMNLGAMTPQTSLASTGYALANKAASGGEALIYQPTGAGGAFTVDLSWTTQQLAVEWFNPTTGAITTASNVAGGSSSQSFTAPSGTEDQVLYLKAIVPGASNLTGRGHLLRGRSKRGQF